jgi:hypothetical protein
MGMRKTLLTVFVVAITLGFGGLFAVEQSMKRSASMTLPAAGSDVDGSLRMVPAMQTEGPLQWHRENHYINYSNFLRRGGDHILDDERYGSLEAGKVRVLAVGDSFLYGTGVSDKDMIWAERLEQKLNTVAGSERFDVQSIAMHGASTLEESEWLTNDLLEMVDPDLIVVGYVINDVIPSGQERQLCGSKIPCDVNTAEDLPQFAACLNGEGGLFSRFAGTMLRPWFPTLTRSVLERFCDLGRIAAEEGVPTERGLQGAPEKSRFWPYFLKGVDRFGEIDLAVPVLVAPLYTGDSPLDRYIKPLEVFTQRGAEQVAMTETLRQLGSYEPKDLWVNPVDGHPGNVLSSAYAHDIAAHLISQRKDLFSDEKTSTRGVSSERSSRNKTERKLLSSVLPNEVEVTRNEERLFTVRYQGGVRYPSPRNAGPSIPEQSAPCAVLNRPHMRLMLRPDLVGSSPTESLSLKMEGVFQPVDVFVTGYDGAGFPYVRTAGSLTQSAPLVVKLQRGDSGLMFASVNSQGCDLDQVIKLPELSLSAVRL